MKNLSIKAKVYLSLQILFTILTFVGAILIFTDKINNAGMSVCCMTFSLVFGAFYKEAKNN